MITDAIFSSFMAFPMLLLSGLPEMSVAIPDGVFEWLFDIANAVGYLLPVSTLVQILGISIAIKGVQIAWAIVLRIKSFIPTMGA